MRQNNNIITLTLKISLIESTLKVKRILIPIHQLDWNYKQDRPESLNKMINCYASWCGGVG